MRKDTRRLEDPLEAIERIEKYAHRGELAFRSDELVQTWILHHLQVIGEAVRSLSPDIKHRYSQVPWASVIGMRNVLVHDYFEVDQALVWSVVENDLPSLKRAVREILGQESQGGA